MPHDFVAKDPCIKVNRSAMPSAYAESELFGHQKAYITAALALGLKPSTLQSRMKKLGIVRKESIR